MDHQNGQNGNSTSTVDGFFSKKKDSNGTSTIDLPIAPKPDSEVYKKYKRRGTAIIFNHKYFNTENMTRNGTEKDRDALEAVLKGLEFDVQVYNDLRYDEILDVVNVVSRMNHSESECFILAVMSHGEEGVLYAKDTTYQTKVLWKYFSPVKCPSLAGKPKLFFIQACRGSKSDPGVKVTFVEEDGNKKKTDNVYTIPIMADILIMYATVEEYYAWRDTNEGSYFIQSLVRQLKKHIRTRDLLSILTCVNREVAIGFTSSESNSEFNGKKEMCSIVSMLTRKYYFYKIE